MKPESVEAANLIAERLAEAPAVVVESILADDWWTPQEPCDVVRDALLAEVEPMSFTGKALFILDALAAAGYVVTRSSEGVARSRPRPVDRAASSGVTDSDGAA